MNNHNAKLNEVMNTSPVIPVIVIDDMKDAVPLAKALVGGGLKVLEITLRTSLGLQAITEIKQAVPDAIVGAGTVNTVESLEQCVAAGAEFLVSPGHSAALVDAALAQEVPFLFGVNTPSEVMGLLDRGITHMKFFPAEAAGGIDMLKSIHAPLPQASFCPTGGVNPNNASSYLALPNVLCVGGTWMLDKQAIAKGDWAAIEAKAASAVALAKGEGLSKAS